MEYEKVALLLIVILLISHTAIPIAHAQNLNFNGSTAYTDLLKQMSFGPRIPGSVALNNTAKYIRNNLTSYGWTVKSQNFTYYNQLLKGVVNGYNLIATLAPTQQGASLLRIVLGAHYDTRPCADGPNSNSSDCHQPVPGADDGASGVAALLELGRIFAANSWTGGLTMVFFDGEDSGLYSGVGWIQGSQYFVGSLNATERSQIKAAIILDMIGYSNLVLRQEELSDFAIRNAIWSDGRTMGYSQFADGIQSAIIDDHKPFLDNGIRAVDIIDLDYPYWHTPYDTADKVSANSLEAVGRTVEAFILAGTIVNPSLPGSFFLVLGGLVAVSSITVGVIVKARRSHLSSTQPAKPQAHLRTL